MPEIGSSGPCIDRPRAQQTVATPYIFTAMTIESFSAAA
jgi:hypothetical protein